MTITNVITMNPILIFLIGMLIVAVSYIVYLRKSNNEKARQIAKYERILYQKITAME